MKLGFILAALLLAMQQQTFYSAKAQPTPVPVHTAQAVNPDYLYYYVHCGGSRGAKGKGSQATQAARPSPSSVSGRGISKCLKLRGNGRPSPRSSQHPAPRHT